MYLVCHMTSHGNLVKGSCEVMGGGFLWYVSILISVVTINTVIVEK